MQTLKRHTLGVEMRAMSGAAARKFLLAMWMAAARSYCCAAVKSSAACAGQTKDKDDEYDADKEAEEDVKE